MISSLVSVSYRQNTELFVEFYALQAEYAAALARLPRVLQAWLDTRIKPARAAEEGSTASQGWRTARLSACRQGELAGMIAQPGGEERLATWLRACLPVLSLLEIGDHARPSLAGIDAAAGELAGRVMALRERVFLANYGLAKAAAAHGRPESYDDRLSAACVGLLDAIDRYVPGERAARFGYFATYWIRYHIGRQAQKFNGVVAFPIYQQRMGRKIEQLTVQRQGLGLGEPGRTEVCAALAVGADAYHRHRQRPSVMSLNAPVADGEGETGLEFMLADPAPAPGAELEDEDVSARIEGWLKRSFPPATRVMLAYAHDLGPLPQAAEEYLTHLREIARERLRFVAE
jgi:DNA-directed RNA polymerase specialized sigma subunit